MSKERKVFTNCESISADKTRVAGTVKWYNPLKGYGFVTTVGENPTDYFVHRTQVYSEDHFPRRPILKHHETVEFAIMDTPQGPAASEVSLPGAVIVPSRLYFRRLRRMDAPSDEAAPKTEAAPANEAAPKREFKPKRRYYRKPRAEKATDSVAPAAGPANADAAPVDATPADAAVKEKAKPKTRRPWRQSRKPKTAEVETAPKTESEAAPEASTTPVDAPKEPAASEK